MLVVIEGVDGVGKTSVANEVAAELEWGHIEFPANGGATHSPIRDYLGSRWEVKCKPETAEQMLLPGTGADRNRHLGAMCFQALQLCNRYENLPALKAGEDGISPLVLSRYWQSGIVYGQLDGLNLHWLEQIHSGLPKASLNILLTAPPKVCAARRVARDGCTTHEIYEGKIQMIKRIDTLYRQLWGAHDGPTWKILETEDLNLEQVTDAICELISEQDH